MSLIEEHRPSPWLGVLLGTTACFSGAALYDRACDGCNAQAETTMLIHFTDLNPISTDPDSLDFDCPHCVKDNAERAPIGERLNPMGNLKSEEYNFPPQRLHVDRRDHPWTCGPDFDGLTLEGIVDFSGSGHWKGVVKNGVVGTIVPLQGNANIRGSAFLGL